MKIQETDTHEPSGISSKVRTFVRVRELAEGESLPVNAVEVPTDTVTHDWQEQS